LDGDYDEEQNANDFAAALAEWRGEKTSPVKPTKLGTQKPKVAEVSPVHTPSESVFVVFQCFSVTGSG